MSLISLSDSVMISTSQAWQAQPVRGVIAKYPLLEAVMPSIAAAHDQLTAHQLGTGDAPLAALQQQEQPLDSVHDQKARGVSALMVALLDLVTAAQAAPLAALHGKLFPSGLTFINSSYAAEAGNAELVRKRLTADDHALLAQVPVMERTLADHLAEWFDAAAQLGALEGQRTAQEKATKAATGRGPHAAARNRWVQTVNVFLANAALASLSAGDRDALFGPLDRAQHAARKPAKATPVDPAPTK